MSAHFRAFALRKSEAMASMRVQMTQIALKVNPHVTFSFKLSYAAKVDCVKCLCRKTIALAEVFQLRGT
jgi:hypothetical protein